MGAPEMAVPLVLLAAVITVVIGRTEWSGGHDNHKQLETTKTTAHCRTSIEVVYPSSEAELPYPVCSSRCSKGEEELWIDGVVLKRFSKLADYNLMVEMSYRNGSLQGCKMVPYTTAQESSARQAALLGQMELCLAEDKKSPVKTLVPSVTERVPRQVPTIPYHKRLEGFTRVGNFFYKTSVSSMTWHPAVDYCYRLGASLAVPKTSYQQNLLLEVLHIYIWVWLGVNDIQAEGIYVDADNTSVTYTYWTPGEPNNKEKESEDCVALMGHGRLQWNDEPCNTVLMALCELPVLKEPRENYWCPKGYWQYKSSCYILSSTKSTYNDGVNFCSNNGAYPVFINSLEEHNFLAGMKPESAFIGYTDHQVEGVFFSYTFGAPLFTNWKPGEPNDRYKDEDCIVIESRDKYLWKDYSCNKKTRILCEKLAVVIE